MKEDLLKELKKEYDRGIDEKEATDRRLKTLMDRKAILENSPIVKGYIELCEQIEVEEEKICLASDVFVDTLYNFTNKGLFDETNGIFLYLGTFITEFGYEKKVPEDYQFAEFARYINIESFEQVDIPVEDKKVFENNNKVLFLTDEETTKYVKYDLRDQFVMDSLSEGQETATKRILSRYKKN